MCMENNIIFDDLRTGRGTYDIACLSGIGRRESQQDAAYAAANDEAVFAVICDGMGGIAGGQLASTTAVEAFTEYYQYYNQGSKEGTDGQWMQTAIEAVDDIVYSLKDAEGHRVGAGTTLIAITVNENRLHWVSVGDSRIYLFRGDEMAKVTNDHNYFLKLDQQREEGTISNEQYHTEARKGEALISFVGMGGLLLIDINEDDFYLEPGDTILLCTDGLYRTISENQMFQIIRQERTAKDIVRRFDAMIAERNSSYQDNYTFILIKKM